MKIVFLCIGITIFCYAKKYDLIEVYNLAYANSESYEISVLKENSSEKEIDKSLAAFYPKVSLDTEYMKLNKYPVIVDGVEKYKRTHRRDITVNVDQVLYDRSKYLDYKDKKNLFNQRVLEKYKEEQQLIFDVTKYYFETIYKAKQVELVEQKLKRFEKIVERALLKYKSGFISKADYLEAKSERDELVTQKLQMNLDFETSKSFLQKLTGVDKMNIKNNIILDNVNVTSVLNEFNGFENNLDFKIQKYKLDRADINSSMAIASFEPTITFNYEHVDNDIEASDNQNTLTFLFSFNIFNGFYDLKNYQQAKIEQSIERLTLKKLVKDIQQNIKNKVNKIKTYHEIILSYPEVLETKAFSLDGMRERFKVGNKSIIDLLDEENKYYEKLNKYTEYKYEFILEYTTLMQYVSRLDERFLNNVNGFVNE